MGIRETLNQNPGITTGVTAGIIVVALIIIGWQMMSSGSADIPTQAYYTIDDGATWFADDINKIAPFDHEGKKAYRVHVFKCGGGEPFISHMERYTDDAKAKLEKARANPQAQDLGIYEEISMTGIEVKDPKTGDKGWIRQSSYEAAARITQPLCPDGTTNNLEQVHP